MNRKIIVTVSATLLLSGLSMNAPAHAAGGGGAQVTHHMPCLFEPGDVPGVDVFFPGDCFSVITPSGQATVVAVGRLPAGFTLSRTFQGPLPCTFFGQSVQGHVAATRSGMVRASCHFRDVS